MRRVRIDAELKKRIARAGEAARFEAAEELGLPVQDGRVLVPDAHLEYTDIDGRSGRVNIEIATDQYSAASIAQKAAAGFRMHGSGGRATARMARVLRGDPGRDGGGGGGRGRDRATIEL